MDAGVGHVVVDNHTDIDLLEEAVPAGAVQRVQLRVAPGISPDTHPSISTGGPNTKFGFGLQSAPAAIERLDASDRLELEGLHLHIGSQIYDVGSFRTALEAMAGLASHGMVNLGGGLGVAYVSAEHPPTIEEYVAAKVSAVHDVMGPGVRILDEPGRALVANSTVTLYTVQSMKRNVDLYVAVDGGMSDNLRPMLYGARYEAQVASRFGGGTYCHLVGKHCESGDLIVRDAELADPRVGRRRRHPGHGRLRLLHVEHLQRRAARAGRDGQGRRRAGRRAPRDLRGPAGAGRRACLSASASGCSGSARWARPSPSCSRRAPTRSRRSPACARS